MFSTILIVAAALTASQPTGAPVYGYAAATDGDSLRLGELSIRLFGIDAPEHDQTCSRGGQEWSCGAEAADRLKRLVSGKEVRCIPVGKDSYDRTLARCSIIGTDINQSMVESGYALAFRKYSLDYAAAEDRAKHAKRGLWSGTFEEPSVFRAKAQARTNKPTARQRPKQKTYSTGACLIKGNHSRRGEWIYHLPGMPYYEQTRPEAWFCTEADAQAAGYRRSRAR